MAQATRISIAAAKAAVDAVVNRIDLGTAGNAKVAIYAGSQPASPDATVGAATLLCEIDLGASTVFGNATTATNYAEATASGVLTATGTGGTLATGQAAAWFRAFDKDGTALIDGTVGTGTAAAFDMIIDNTSITSGQQVKLTAWKVRLSKV